MRSSIAKSIYVGAAVLGLAGLSAVTTTTASAKSYATAGSYTALTKGQNVLVNGTNAIYSKPGTVKGAKVVASKKTVAKLAASKKSSDTFYAYGTKTTNRGSVYYKIVTMDKKYRGYIYGGKTAGTFAGGIKTTETLTTATNPSQLNNYYLKDVSKNTLWTAPKNTDINAKKVSLYGVAKNAKFSIDKSATKTKEGSLYYHVVAADNSGVSGWIYAGGLTTDTPAATATDDNSVTIKYVDSSYNTVGAAKSFVTSETGTKKDTGLSDDSVAALNTFADANAPEGYTVAAKSAFTTSVKYGQTVQVQVVKAATSKVSFKVVGSSTTAPATIAASDLAAKAYPALTPTQQKAFTGKATDAIDLSANDLFAANGALNQLVGATKTDADGVKTHDVYTFDAATTKSANANAKYGDAYTAYYTVATQPNAAPQNSTETGNTNYVG
ncbi:S-layer protein [Levilactobacillus brevis]|uniref:S-layer protein n=1 Tax=Levilactobacillus brevis TaxID=1580 RepID=UPI001BDEA552|nr:S-layer protein [Levilactobacillus brevis]